MLRRSFVKAAAAVLAAPFVPVVSLRQSIDREALMLPFCGDGLSGGMRYSLEKPFQDGLLTYASDAYRLIRGETEAPQVEGEQRRLPPAARAFERCRAQVGRFRPQPVIPVAALTRHGAGHDCPVCCGRRISLGDTYPDFSNFLVDAQMHRLGYDVDDNTVRDANCPQCHGLEYRGPNIIEINGAMFAYARLIPMFAIPELEVAVGKDLLVFRSRACELEGVVMGLVP